MLCESKGDGSYLFLNQSKAGTAQKFDELGIKFVVRVPWTSSELYGGIEVGEHVDFPRWVLGGNGRVSPRVVK